MAINLTPKVLLFYTANELNQKIIVYVLLFAMYVLICNAYSSVDIGESRDGNDTCSFFNFNFPAMSCKRVQLVKLKCTCTPDVTVACKIIC